MSSIVDASQLRRKCNEQRDRTIALDDASNFGLIHLVPVTVTLNKLEQGADYAVLNLEEEPITPDNEGKLMSLVV